ncbi:thioredoxin fold domain-containing protein [Desulfobacter vibrioformis]|uniref:thioredoxin fold domain-containing protein n=1 Tax=Desulfobacter vibrioformis TaxID=34031 RepID=UPI00068D4989|nr:thioredoxin fold domain-containing protein [Desulfobacter vibrioformis]
MTSKTRFRCLAVLMLGFFVLSAGVSPGRAESVCDHVTLAWLQTQVPVPKDAELVFKKDQGVICEAVLSIEGGLAPVYAGKDFIVAGQLYKNGVSITRNTMSSLSDVADAARKKAREKEAKAVEMRKTFFKTHAADLADLVSLSFSPQGSSDKFIYVISDPACSHCEALLGGLEDVAAETGLTLKLVIYPVLGEQSKTMAAHVICNRLSYGAYKTLKRDDAAEGCDKADLRINKTFDLLKKADISFVPLVIAQDGSWMVEGNDICGVREHLGLDPGTGEKGGDCQTAQEE